MPNWCYNTLTVSGEKEDVVRFRKENKEKDVNNKIKDVPLSFIKAIPYKGNWNHEWCIKNWGTKWDVSDVETQLNEINDTDIQYNFNTAWVPPEKWFRFIVKKYPKLYFHLEYEEEGIGFSGEIIAENGEIVEEVYEE